VEFFIVVLHIPPQKKHNNDTEGPDLFLIIMDFITKTAKATEQTESLIASGSQELTDLFENHQMPQH
jgi:hypothetical protein